MPAYKLFKQRHPDYNAEYWARCRALYAGGRKLLGDKKLLKVIFPQHVGEEDSVYQERLKRAFYIPYAGQIVDFIVAAMSSDPLQMLVEGELPEGSPGHEESEKPPTDPFYEEFAEDVTRPGGRRIPMAQFIRQQLLEALIVQKAWTLVELPEMPMDLDSGEPVKPTTLAEEEQLGLRDAYLVPICAEQVVDWEMDDDGQLAWALVLKSTNRRRGLASGRNIIREEYTLYGPETWERFAIEWDQEKKPDGPDDDDECGRISGGGHSFGQVPLLTLDMPDGLWAMGKIESIAVEHFNKRCALSWGQYRSLFQFLAVHLAPLDPLNSATDDPNRGVNQRVGHGRVMVLGEKDKVGFVGPDSAPFSVAMEDLAILRDEMMRVLHHMALSIDNSGAALQRSGKSKQVDQSATTVVLKALGLICREHSEEIYRLVGEGRKDAIDWCAHGMDEFDEMSLEGMLEEAATLETVDIPSATFQQHYKFMLAKNALGSSVSDEVLNTIREELKGSISQESIEAKDQMAQVELETAQTPPEPAAVQPAKPKPAKPKKPPKA
jgi:hypothetical protein